MAKNEEFSDLTESEEMVPEKTAKPKRAKKAKEPNNAAVTPKKENGDKPKKKKRIKLLIILAAVFVLLIGVAAMLFFNLYEARTNTIAFINRFDPEYVSLLERTEAADIRENELDDRVTDLDSWENDLAGEQARINSERAMLNQRIQEVEERERALPHILRVIDNNEHIYSLAQIYATMAPAAAAERLYEFQDNYEVAAIIFAMEERNAAHIMAQMSPDFAARVSEILMFSERE